MITKRILPLLAVGIVILAAIFIFFASRPDAVDQYYQPSNRLDNIAVTEVDADSTADTIRALTGEVDRSKEEMFALTQKAIEQAAAKESIIDDADAKIKELESIVNSSQREYREFATEQNRVIREQLLAVQREVQELKGTADRMQFDTRGSTTSRSDPSTLQSVEDFITGAELPTGLGLDGTPAGQEVNGIALSDIVWINPLDRPDVNLDNADSSGNKVTSKLANPALGLSRSSTGSSSSNVGGSGSQGSSSSRSETGQAQPPVENKIFTVPDLSMMTDAVGLTALVGRIYTDNEVTDPWPFKTMVRRQNVSANYTALPPDLDGMLFEGYAVGDWTLGCVRGWLTAATFVFKDGSTISAYANSPGSRPKESRLNKQAIGYITDQYGNPCISGQKLTDAPKFLATQTLTAGVLGFADALNDEFKQRSTITGTDGSTTTVDRVINPTREYARNEAYVAALQESGQWIRDRQKQSFDAVYAPPGETMVVNLQTELRLDRTKDDRRISYSNTQLESHYETLD